MCPDSRKLARLRRCIDLYLAVSRHWPSRVAKVPDGEPFATMVASQQSHIGSVVTTDYSCDTPQVTCFGALHLLPPSLCSRIPRPSRVLSAANVPFGASHWQGVTFHLYLCPRIQYNDFLRASKRFCQSTSSFAHALGLRFHRSCQRFAPVDLSVHSASMHDRRRYQPYLLLCMIRARCI